MSSEIDEGSWSLAPWLFRPPAVLWGMPVVTRAAEESDRAAWIEEVKQRLGLITADECACIDAGHGTWITNSCPLHNPFSGLLVQQPVQFTGLLSVLEQENGC